MDVSSKVGLCGNVTQHAESPPHFDSIERVLRRNSAEVRPALDVGGLEKTVKHIFRVAAPADEESVTV